MAADPWSGWLRVLEPSNMVTSTLLPAGNGVYIRLIVSRSVVRLIILV